MKNLPLFIAAVTLTISASHAERRLRKDLVEKILAAAPTKSRVQPRQARKVLIYTRATGFVHSSIPYGARAIEAMGKNTKAFEPTITDDPFMFEADKLKDFDAIFLVNTTGDLFRAKKPGEKMDAATSARLRENLEKFILNGGGLGGCHAATDCFYSWQGFGLMLGGYFSGHPWHEKVGIKLDEPDHPLVAAFSGQDFFITDEIYQFRAPWSRGRLRVLLSLDVTKTNMNKGGIRRKDGDFGVSWIRNHGKGRVFYSSLGHREEIYWNPMVMKYYLDGIQFMVGDLDVDATPSGDVRPFKSLFSGSDTSAFEFKSGGWVAEEGALALKRGGGYAWTKESYGNFVLDLDFKLSKGANSGIFIRTGNKGDAVQSGIEVQVYDTFGKENPGKNDNGAVYDVMAPSSNPLKKAGEWNHYTITCYDNKIEIVLNGAQIIDMDLDKWAEAGKNPDGSKNKFRTAYKDMPREGFIGFQDHGNAVWYRNVNVLPLNKERRAAVSSLAGVSEDQRLPRLLEQLAGAKTNKARKDTEAILIYAARSVADQARRADLILDALKGASKEVRISLLRMMGNIGGEKVLGVLRNSCNETDPGIRAAAVQGLANWPDTIVMDELLEIARTAKEENIKSIAIKGYASKLKQPSSRSAEETLNLYKNAIALAPTAERKMLLDGVAGMQSLNTLKALEGWFGDANLQTDAGWAIVKLAGALSSKYKSESEDILVKVATATKDGGLKRSAQQAIDKIHQFEDFITTWLFSGPYMDKDARALLKTPFPPEFGLADAETEEIDLEADETENETDVSKPGARWQSATTGEGNNAWMVDFNKLARGSNRAAYLRTWVRSEKAQKVQLQIGSDDGVKVWLNGKVIHTKDVNRGIQPGQDKVNVDLQAGWNEILMKVRQGGGGWSACARFRAINGKSAAGLLLPGDKGSLEAAVNALKDPKQNQNAAAALITMCLAAPDKAKEKRSALKVAIDITQDNGIKDAARNLAK